MHYPSRINPTIPGYDGCDNRSALGSVLYKYTTFHMILLTILFQRLLKSKICYNPVPQMPLMQSHSESEERPGKNSQESTTQEEL